MKVLDLKSTPNWNTNPRNLYCGRENRSYGLVESIHHNPFPLEKEAERGSTLIKYTEFLESRIVSDLVYRAQVTCLDSVADNLMCWCKPHPCHCDILVSKWEQLNIGRPATYAGIGSRETPERVLAQMEAIAGFLAMCGYTLRSGGADGADTAFFDGAMAQMGGINGFTYRPSHTVLPPQQFEIYLPWEGFNNLRSNFGSGRFKLITGNIWHQAELIAEQYHPAWHRLTRGGRALQTRNVFQIMGPDLKTPSHFVVCWTSDGQATGGTGQAIRIANSIGIPVYNLYNQSDIDDLLAAIKVQA